MRLSLLLVPFLLAPASFAATIEPTSASLDEALTTIDAGKIRSDLFFIAADELQGRDTPSVGLRIAARYIRARLERLGFTPGGDDGFFDVYSMARVGVDLEATSLFAKKGGETLSLEFGKDYYFRSAGFVALDVEGPVVFAGTGTDAELSSAGVAGRWALIHDSEMPVRERRDRAQAAGALGLVVMAPKDEPEAFDRGARYRRRAAMRGTLRVVETSLPELSLTSDGVESLLGDVTSMTVGQVLPFTLRDVRRTSGEAEALMLENVAGLWPGSDPELKHEVIVLSAHYDHVGVEDGDVYNGADDNGSGTVGLLALAEALSEYGPLRRSVLILWVSGEEKGLKGSYAWTVEPTLPEGYRAVCNLNIDMIGRNAPDSLLVTPSNEHPAYNALVKVAEHNARLEGFGELGSADQYWRRSDHMNFADVLEIPVAFLFSDIHEDYHKPTDTAEKVDCDKIRRVTRLLMRMLVDLQADELL